MILLSPKEFDRAVAAALNAIPDEFRPHLENVIIDVQDRPSPELLAEGDFDDDLLGLYVGVPLEDKGIDGEALLPDRVLIFRENLCDMCGSVEELIDEIRVTVLHEVGHHFGLSEERLDELGYA